MFAVLYANGVLEEIRLPLYRAALGHKLPLELIRCIAAVQVTYFEIASAINVVQLSEFHFETQAGMHLSTLRDMGVVGGALEMKVKLPAKSLGTVEHFDDIAKSSRKTLGQRAGARQGGA